MAIKLIPKGSTSVILEVKLYDSTSTTGGAKAALIHSDITATYHRNTSSGTGTSITMATMTLGTFTSGGFKKVNDSTMPGVYQFCPPDACFATGADSVSMSLTATGAVQCDIEIQLRADWASGENDGLLTFQSSTVTRLASTEPTGTDKLKNFILVLPSTRQARLITAWDGTNKDATHAAWVTNPSTNDAYYLIPGDAVNVGAVTSTAANTIRDATTNDIIETAGNYTVQQALSIILAYIAGETPDQQTFKTPDGTATRIAGTCTAAGLRSAITLTPSA